MASSEHGMSFIVKTVTRLVCGLVAFYGIYAAFHSHSAPGGGFAGGVIVALAFIQVVIAFGREGAHNMMRGNAFRIVMGLALLIFISIISVSALGGCLPLVKLFGAVTTCPLFNNDIMIPLTEMVIIGTGIGAVFMALTLLGKDSRNGCAAKRER